MLFSSAFLAFYFSLFLVLLVLWWLRKPQFFPKLEEFPRVSILIAARDEEGQIISCLEAIDRLDYPKDKLEVLVGDDRSTDRTRALVLAFAQTHPYVTCLPIVQNLPGTKGKANVLTQLAHKASSDYYFITDADIEVPRQWVKTLLSAVTPQTGIVTGITTTKGTRLFHRLQTLDWLYNLGLMQVVADRGLAVSTMGNNMLVTRAAYEAVGGFEKIPFSVTEDVQLFRQVLAKGFKTANVYLPEVLALSSPSPNLASLLHQRRRWMRGSVQLPWYMLLLFVVHSTYYPVWLPFFLHSSVWVMLALAGLKIIIQGVFVKICARRVGFKTSWAEMVYLEIYLLITTFILLIYFFLPTKISWKGRQY